MIDSNAPTKPQWETEPEWGVTYNRSWAITEIAHPAVEGKHGDCVDCLRLDAIDEAVRTGQRTATVERAGHSKTVHEMIGTSGSYYMTPEDRARRDEEDRVRAELIAAGASARDIRRFYEGRPFLCPVTVCGKEVDKPGVCDECVAAGRGPGGAR